MSAGPLDDPRLRAVEACLNEARFDEAQKQLGELGGSSGSGPGAAYLTARLLHERGRIDVEALIERLEDLLLEYPDFPEARALLEARGGSMPDPSQPRFSTRPRLSSGSRAAVSARLPPSVPHPPVSRLPALKGGPLASSAPPRLETPRVPGPLAPLELDTLALGTAVTQPVQRRIEPYTLGALEPPRSELPTDPAPPPSDRGDVPAFDLVEPASVTSNPWDPLEVALASGRSDAALAALETLATERLRTLLEKRNARLDEAAGDAADFFNVAPVFAHFAPFDLSLDSLERLDDVIALLTQQPFAGSRHGLTALLTTYVGECVRGAASGHWQGLLTEPERAEIQRRSSESYFPWSRVEKAFREGSSLRAEAGPRPHPAAEPPERGARNPRIAPTSWDPAPWPDLQKLTEFGRALPASVVGAWARRVARTPLDRSAGSLPALERYLDLLTPRPPSLDVAWARRPAAFTGAYLGDLLCLHGAGRWNENDAAPSGPLRFEVLMPDGTAAYPVLWAFDRLRGRPGPSLSERVQGVLDT